MALCFQIHHNWSVGSLLAQHTVDQSECVLKICTLQEMLLLESRRCLSVSRTRDFWRTQIRRYVLSYKSIHETRLINPPLLIISDACEFYFCGVARRGVWLQTDYIAGS